MGHQEHCKCYVVMYFVSCIFTLSQLLCHMYHLHCELLCGETLQRFTSETRPQSEYHSVLVYTVNSFLYALSKCSWHHIETEVLRIKKGPSI